jgi:catechol 2,3-dioxygenase-like lactoylglutathione lyase family enzyme
MAGERMYPILPCPDVDEAVAFYEALGFRRTYRQQRPNPHAVVEREDMGIHLAGIDGFDPAGSYASVIITVPDAEALYGQFADGLRAHLGRLPTAGIPRLLRPRRKQGTATGFTVVDVGGNWLRFYRAADAAAPEEPEVRTTGLARAVEVAARQGDARGDDASALQALDAGLTRHPDAPPVDRVRALAYRAELLHRLGRDAEARAAFDDADAVGLTPAEQDAAGPDLAHAREVVGG